MVWGLFPVDPLPGEEKYYFCRKGTYKVGRKGCDVIINKDKGVSRIHAEIAINAMNCVDLPKKNISNTSSEVHIRDCSKYGTFINKNTVSKKNVGEFPNKETTLNDGDLISFGTGTATYRFCHVPLVFLVFSSEPLQENQLLQDMMSSIGASVASTSVKCTHVLVDDFMPLTEEILDAVVAKKPLAKYGWVEAIAEKKICTDIPSCSSYSPRLVLEGVEFKVAETKSQENCLRGFLFLLESEEKYKFKDKLQLLLKASSARVVSVEQFYLSSQDVENERNDRLVGVVPAGLANNCGYFRNLSSVSRVNEIDLISAALSGYLNPSVIVSPPVIVSSSCSTDETVVADSDEEMETATSVHNSTAVCITKSTENESKEEIVARTLESTELHSKGGMIFSRKESIKHDIKEDMAVQMVKSGQHDGKGEISPNHVADNTSRETLRECSIKSLDESDERMAKIEKIDEPTTGNLDIIYSQNLIVRDTNLSASTCSFSNNATVNFKRFRKATTESGNSFHNLVPFSKYPYKDFDYGDEEMQKEEKRRKQMEAVAEDLFNNEKGRRRGVTGSLRSLFAPS